MRHALGRILPFVFLIALVVALSLTARGFATLRNAGTILRFSSVIVIMGVGMTFVIISAGIDLSVGSVLAFASIIAAWAMKAGMPLAASLLLGILTGTAWGVFNGGLIILLDLPPFVVTLASMWMARGSATLLAKWISGYGTSIEITSDGFGFVGAGDIGGWLPTPLVIMAVVVVLGHYVLRHTRLGRYTFAIGSNPEAARFSGISVRRYTMAVYVILGTLAGLAGMIEASINRGGHATLGEGYELHVIAAVIIGGGSFSGGVGSIAGTVTGALIMGVIRNGCILLGLDYEWQLVVISLLIIIAVAFDTFQRRRTGG